MLNRKHTALRRPALAENHNQHTHTPETHHADREHPDAKAAAGVHTRCLDRGTRTSTFVAPPERAWWAEIYHHETRECTKLAQSANPR
jgi:hypothetical protein